ncbi:hypothetical protein JCM10295v2_004305 [Rhodotorula toruloides]
MLLSRTPNTEKPFDDSDNESDAVYFRRNPVKASEEAAAIEHKNAGTAFSTYRPVLACLRAGYIAFAPLSSPCPSRGSPKEIRNARVELAAAAEPDMPLPRLAQLDLPPRSPPRTRTPRAPVSLTTSKKTLTPDSAAHELFDGVSVLHDPWRRVVIEYVGENWDAVHATKGRYEVEKRVEEEKVPGAAKIMVQLSRARQKARA